MVFGKPENQRLKDGRRVSAGPQIWGRSSTKLVCGGDENRNAKPGFAILNGPTRFSGETVNSSICVGPNNRQVSNAAGVADQGQISKVMMARLEGQGLVENTGGDTQGEREAWRMTPRGEEQVLGNPSVIAETKTSVIDQRSSGKPTNPSVTARHSAQLNPYSTSPVSPTDSQGIGTKFLRSGASLLVSQIRSDDLFQSLTGDFVDAGFSGTGGVALSVGQGVQREGAVGVFAGRKDDAPWSIGPGDASLGAAAEFGSVSAFGLAAQQARLGQAAVAVDFAAQLEQGSGGGVTEMFEIGADGLLVEDDRDDHVPGLVGHGSALVVGGQVSEVQLEVLGAHRSCPVTGEDRFGAEVSAIGRPPVGEELRDSGHVLVGVPVYQRMNGLACSHESHDATSPLDLQQPPRIDDREGKIGRVLDGTRDRGTGRPTIALPWETSKPSNPVIDHGPVQSHPRVSRETKSSVVDGRWSGRPINFGDRERKWAQLMPYPTFHGSVNCHYAWPVGVWSRSVDRSSRPSGAQLALVGLARQGFAKSDVSAVEPLEAQVRLDLESEALGLAGFYLVEARARVSQVGLYVGERAGSFVCSHVGILAHVPGGSGGCFDSTTAAIPVTLTTSLSTVSVRPESSASCLSRRSTSSAAVASDDVVASATGSAYLSDPAAVEIALGNSLFSPRETMVVAPTNSASTTKPRSSKNTNVELMAMAGNRAGTRAKTVTRVAPITQATASQGRLLSRRDVGPGISLGMSRLSPTVGEDGDNILTTDRSFQCEAVLVSMSTVQSLSDTRNTLGVGPSIRAELSPYSTSRGSDFDMVQQRTLSPKLSGALGV
jgi:hypothetical protein